MMKAKQIKPVFDDLNNPETIISHVEQLIKKTGATPHAEILQQLIEQLEPLDFELLAFPQVEAFRKKMQDPNVPNDEKKEVSKQLEKLKLNVKHYLVLSIENALLFAEKNRWGLCKNHDFIYLYNGTFWAEIDKETFQKFLGESAEKMGVAKFSARFYQFREQLFKQFLATAYLPTP